MTSKKKLAFNFSKRSLRTVRQPIAYLMQQAVENRELISLAAGLVDDQMLPVEEVSDLVSEMLADVAEGQAALQYGSTAGLTELRRMLLEHIASLDGLTVDQLNATPENVIISSGSQQLLFILSDIFIDPGNIVIMAWPSYYVYTGTLQSMGAEVRTVEMDEAGIRTDDLENVLQSLAAEGKLQKVKILYLQTYHQNPTGLTLSAERRPIVVDLVKKYSTNHKILILEDAACRELTYEGQQLPSIKKYDPTNEFVLVTHTFSKTFAPGVRTGYALLPNDLVKPFMLQKGNHDFGSGSFCQHLLLAAMKKGVYQKHLAALCTRYTAKRDAMLEALEENLGGPSGTIRWHKPSGGLYVYLTFPETIDTGQDGQLFQAALNEGVLYLPGEFCFGPDPTRRTPRNTMRLCFGKVSIEQIRQGIVRLAKAIQTTQTSATGRS